MTQNPFLSDKNLSCSKCGYDLRQTVLGGNCPECGTSVLAAKIGYRVDGDTLIVKTNAVLPARCIKTNETLELQTKSVTKYYFPNWVYVLILINLLILLIVYMIVRKPVVVTYSIGKTARTKIWIKAGVAAGIAALLTFGCCIFSNASTPAYSIISMGLGVVSFLVMFTFFDHVGVSKKVGDSEYVLTGCCKEFIEQTRREQDAGAGTP